VERTCARVSSGRTTIKYSTAELEDPEESVQPTTPLVILTRVMQATPER